MKKEPQQTVKTAAEKVIAIIRTRVGEPTESTIAALTRIGDLSFDAKTEARVLIELDNLATDLWRRMFAPEREIERLRNTIELFERRIGGSL